MTRAACQPIYQVLLYPVLDDRMTTPSMRKMLDTPLWNGRSSVHMWRHYLGDAVNEDDTSPYAAPARAKDLAGLPPAALTTAEFDPLRDEAIEYAQRLMQAGVPTELHVVPGAIHAFDGLRAGHQAFAAGARQPLRRAEHVRLARTRRGGPSRRGSAGSTRRSRASCRSCRLPGGATLDEGRKLLEDMLGG